MSDGKRGIGDNSRNEAILKNNYREWLTDTHSYLSLNPVNKEFLELIKKKIDQALKHNSQSQDEHRASHGDEYYFKDEINKKESSDALGKISFGVLRKPNSYEKKVLARESELSSGKVTTVLLDMSDLIKSNFGGEKNE